MRAGDRALLLVGGRPGRGNESFKTHQNNAPAFAESGEEVGVARRLPLSIGQARGSCIGRRPGRARAPRSRTERTRAPYALRGHRCAVLILVRLPGLGWRARNSVGM